MILNEGLEKFLESVQSKPIAYGMNRKANNGQIFNAGNRTGTIFFYDGLYYAVVLQKVPVLNPLSIELKSQRIFEVQFGTSSTYSSNIDEYSDDRNTSTKNAIKAFSHIFFTISEIINAIGNVEYVIFDGVDEKRHSLYSVMVNNKLLRRAIEENISFLFVGEKLDYFIFKNGSL